MPLNAPQFNESHPELQGFSDYYQRSIRPILRAEDSRRKLGLLIILITVPLILAAGYGVFLLLKTKTALGMDKVIIFSGVLTGAALVFAVVMAHQKLRADTKALLANAVCGFFGWRFYPTVKNGKFLDEFADYGLVPSAFTDAHFSDFIIGEVKGTTFNSLSLHMLDDKALAKGKRKVTAFKGTLFRIEFPKKVFGRTVVLRDKGVFNPKRKSGLKKVGLVDPVFNAAFQAYGSDQVEARYILTPDIMQDIVDLEMAVAGQKIRFGFMRNQLLIAIETGGRLSAGSMLRPLEDPSRMQKILDEVSAIHHLVDAVLALKK